MAKKVAEMSADPSEKEIVDEKKILKEAEEREKERKAEEKAEKAEAKEVEAEESHAAKALRGKKAKVGVRKKPKHGKNYRKLAEQIDKGKEYPLSEAIELVCKTSPAKFDATIELHVRISEKEKNIRGMVTLPGGLVKEKKILEVTEKNADDIIAKVKANKMDFDIMVADLKVMPKLAMLAKILGPKGLMPSPKAGTAVEDVARAVEELRGGKVEYRADSANIVHMPIGKISFGPEKIAKNYEALIHVLPQKKIESIYIASTMGPSIKVAKK